jgi:decaprenyl-phosphate phosphoribosyltransferase
MHKVDSMAADSTPPRKSRPLDYVQLARVDHWFKNLLMLPGTFMAVFLAESSFLDFGGSLAIGLASACLVASANYVLNEWLDAPFDRHHPVKKERPSVAALLDRRLVWAEYAVLTAGGLGLAALVSSHFLIAAALLWIMGLVYNVEPLRTKDRVILDVLSESLNNAIRLLLGWFIVIDPPLPPVSLIIGYWTLGSFLMTIKRYAEFRFIGSSETAARYRRSFRFYTVDRLLISAMFYASSSSFFLGVFLVKYRVELMLTLPFLALAFAWYLYIGMKPMSAAQAPERLYREWRFTAYIAFVGILLLVALLVDIPLLRWFLGNAYLG